MKERDDNKKIIRKRKTQKRHISYFTQTALGKFHENFKAVVSGFSFPALKYIHT